MEETQSLKRKTESEVSPETPENPKKSRIEEEEKSRVALTYKIRRTNERKWNSEFQIAETATIYGLMNLICETWLYEMRDGDSDIYGHLWEVSAVSASGKVINTYTSPGHWDNSPDSTEGTAVRARLVDLVNEDGSYPDFNITYDMGTTTSLSLGFVSKMEVNRVAFKRLPRCVQTVVDTTTPLLTDEEIKASIRYRERMANTVETEFSRRQEKVIIATPRPWSREECFIITSLIEAGVGFAKAWEKYLQHCLLFRSKGTTSGKYFELKKFNQSYCPAGSRDLKTTLEEVFPVLKNVRSDCLKSKPRVAKYQTIEEYRSRRSAEGWL